MEHKINICEYVPHCVMHQLFLAKCFKNCKNILTYSEVMSKITVASFFWDMVSRCIFSYRLIFV